jgi:ring-1,2-phenylacetyl-CoA epoxidase subunit PaaC
MYTGDLFEMTDEDALLIKEGIAFDLSATKNSWNEKVKEFIDQATLQMPQNNFMQKGSRSGIHSECLSYLLAEMQSIPRSIPGANW